MVNELTDTSDSFVLLYRLPKVISEMVGQPCRFAATTRRSSPTISEIAFRNHSMPKNVRSLRKFRARQRLSGCSAGFQTCCIADFKIGGACDGARLAGLETH